MPPPSNPPAPSHPCRTLARRVTPYLQFASVTKTYVGVTALQDVSFAVCEGTVHALMGENGAGKSTLLKALSGAHRPTSGRILLGGRAHEFAATSAALAAGVAVIYQELHLVPEMTVAENIFLGHLPQRRGVIDRPTLVEKASALLRRLGEDIAPDTKLARLSIGQRQMVEIAKALSRGAKVIAFDEPTSSLSVREIERLFAVIRELRAQRCVILYVTHRMEEVFALCDACTVLRDGRHVRTYEALRETTPAQLVRDMVGRDIADVYAYAPRPHGPTACAIRAVAGPGIRAPVTFSVAQGEILGLFGLVGAGRTELLKLLFGAERATAGSVTVHGEPIALHLPADAIAAGIVYCTEDRKREGIVPILSVQENCNLGVRAPHTRWGGLLDGRWERDNATAKVRELAVRTPSVDQLIKHLSGGNQQKVILARWLSTRIRVLLLDEPTRGIDVGAKSEIYRLIRRLASEGVAVILVSSDLPEAIGLADRVAVMRQGELAAILDRADATPERVLSLALPQENAPAALSLNK
ncbi:MAG: L-arabinose ABC transporter ATP-binding protein AraG [Candidatus Didemnitutus sp.]|nr:L-arabinose ABC transporter ATP-binding protein AraG [Candidatus Didemnitutus sp.]